MNCPKCNAEVEDSATFCNSCGYKLSGDGQILSTNAVVNIQDKSAQLFDRVTYSTVTKVLFFSTVLAMVGGVLSMFSLVEGVYAYALPGIEMAVMLTFLTIRDCVDINRVSKETLDNLLRLSLTFFAYSLFLSVVGDLVIGVAMLVGSWKYASVISFYTIASFVYLGVSLLGLLIIAVICMVASVRVNHK